MTSWGNAIRFAARAPLAVPVTLVLVTGAAAQVMMPGAMPGAAPTAPQAAAPQGAAPQGAPPCFNDFLPLRTEAEKRAGAIQAAAKRKAPPDELCKLFRTFAEAEVKLVKFMSSNQAWCGIPPQAVEQSKANHTKTIQTRDKICTAAANNIGAAPRPSGPGLSEALGTSRLPMPNTASGRASTFDTLTGNVLAR